MSGSAEAATLPGGDTVLVEISDRIAWVTMNRPEKRNAGPREGHEPILDEKSYRSGLAAHRREG